MLVASAYLFSQSDALFLQRLNCLQLDETNITISKLKQPLSPMHRTAKNPKKNGLTLRKNIVREYLWLIGFFSSLAFAFDVSVASSEFAQVTIDPQSLYTTYDGSAKAVTYTTNPPGLEVSVRYNDQTNAPSEAGNYTVLATISSPGFSGSASGVLNIAKANLPLTVSDLYQTYNGSYLPVQISYAGNFDSGLEYIPNTLTVNYDRTGGGPRTTVQYIISNLGYLPTNSFPPNSPAPPTQFADATVAGSYMVSIETNNPNFQHLNTYYLNVSKKSITEIFPVVAFYNYPTYGSFSGWPELELELSSYNNIDPTRFPVFTVTISGNGMSPLSSNYSLFITGPAWSGNSARLSPSGSYGENPSLQGTGFPNYPGFPNPHSTPYDVTISSNDTNIDGSLSYSLFILPQRVSLSTENKSYEYDGKYWDKIPYIHAQTTNPPSSLLVHYTNSQNDEVSETFYVYLRSSDPFWRIADYTINQQYPPIRIPIPAPGNYSFTVNASTPPYINYEGFAQSEISISKRSLSFECRNSGEEAQETISRNATDSYVPIPITLPRVIFRDNNGDDIGTKPPNIKVFYRGIDNPNEISQVYRAEQAPYSPYYHHGELAFFPISSENNIPPGSYNVQIEIDDTQSLTAEEERFLKYFSIDNLSGNFVTLHVESSKATPQIEPAPVASGIVFGQTLDESVLNGGTASHNGTQVAGAFSFAVPSSKPAAGTALHEVKFTPSDPEKFESVTFHVSVSVIKAEPMILQVPSVQALKFGQALSSALLSGGQGNVSGTFAFLNPTFTPLLGDSSQTIVFSPADSGNYTSANASVNVQVLKGESVISHSPVASSITYGQPLSASVLSGGVSSVPGTFSFANPALVPPAGSQPQTVLFTPADTTSYDSTTVNVTVQVNQAAALVSAAPTAADINYGQPLSASDLVGGIANVPGNFTFLNSSLVPPAGTAEQMVVFTPVDSVNFSSATLNVTVTVQKASSVIVTPPAASAITFGQNLTASILTGGGANTPGNFTFSNSTVVPGAGNSSHQVVFVPADSGNFTMASANVSLFVNKATPTVSTLPAASAIHFGQTLSDVVLSGGVASVPGGFSFVNATIFPAVGNGTFAVVFTPSDSGNYSTTGSNITVLVNKAAATILTPPSASPIRFGQALASSILTGVANVPGVFAFADPDLKLSSGTSVQQVVFNPTDSGNYTATNATVTVVVLDPEGDEDGDGLKNSVETNTGIFVSPNDSGTDPVVADTNGDGFSDGEAVNGGLDPLVNYAAAIALVKQLVEQDHGRFGICSTDAMMDLSMGGLTIQKTGNMATVELQLQTTPDLGAQPFTNLGAPVEFQVEMPGNKGFLRVRANAAD